MRTFGAMLQEVLRTMKDRYGACQSKETSRLTHWIVCIRQDFVWHRLRIKDEYG